MADRFPSIEELDAGAVTAQVSEAPAGSPSADDFLAREKALLGDDAQQFATSEDAAALGGDDLIGQGSAGADAAFESQFPDIIASAPTAQTTNITAPSVNYNSGFATQAEEEEEPEVIRLWREKRDAANAKRAEQYVIEHAATIQEAQNIIDSFYESYNNKKEKSITQTRKEAEQFLANRQDTTSGGTSWERIAKLADVSGKGAKGGATGSGKERFRELLMSLRKDPNAPGSQGI